MAKNRNINLREGLSFGTAPEVRNVELHEVQQTPVQKRYDTLTSTQGRKGHKLPRINMAFTTENYEFVKRTSRQLGISATEYVNNLIEKAKK